MTCWTSHQELSFCTTAATVQQQICKVISFRSFDSGKKYSARGRGGSAGRRWSDQWIKHPGPGLVLVLFVYSNIQSTASHVAVLLGLHSAWPHTCKNLDWCLRNWSWSKCHLDIYRVMWGALDISTRLSSIVNTGQEWSSSTLENGHREFSHLNVWMLKNGIPRTE